MGYVLITDNTRHDKITISWTPNVKRNLEENHRKEKTGPRVSAMQKKKETKGKNL